MMSSMAYALPTPVPLQALALSNGLSVGSGFAFSGHVIKWNHKTCGLCVWPFSPIMCSRFILVIP